MPMFTASLFTRAKKWKLLKYLSPDEWKNKRRYVHTMEYYSAIKRMKFNTCYNVNLKNIMLSERSQTQKAVYRMIAFIRNIQNREHYRDRE